MSLKTRQSTMRWVSNYDEFRIDAVTGSVLSMAGNMPVVCHENTVTGSIRQVFALSGAPMARETLSYRTDDEAVQRVMELARRGCRIAYSYPPSPELAARCELVLPVTLYDWLNDKSNIDRLCDPAWLPPHTYLSRDRVDRIADVLTGTAVFVKVCHPGVSGGGTDVRYCPDDESRVRLFEWLEQRPDGWTGLRVEEEVELRDCWCINLAVTADGVRYLGSATQLFAAPARQSGSLIDPQRQPSAETLRVAADIAERGRQAGFVGVCGLDIGEAPAGRPCVFDLNFRLASCTEQVLFHDAVTTRVGARVSQSWASVLSCQIEDVLERIEPLVGTGQFVPFRLYDRSRREGDRSRVGGLVVGDDPDETSALANSLSERLADLA